MTTQGGAGEGTVDRKRRDPAQRGRVESVEITEASGLSLGPDGRAHPLETTSQGELKVTDKDVPTLLTELIDLQKRILFALTDGSDMDYEEILDEILPDC